MSEDYKMCEDCEVEIPKEMHYELLGHCEECHIKYYNWAIRCGHIKNCSCYIHNPINKVYNDEQQLASHNLGIIHEYDWIDENDKPIPKEEEYIHMKDCIRKIVDYNSEVLFEKYKDKARDQK